MRLNFKKLGLLSGKAARACSRSIGLTSARLDLMMLVWRYDRSQIEIATLLCVSPSVISRMVDALEERELVARIRTRDRRFRLVRITAEGRRRLRMLDVPGLERDGVHGAQSIGERTWLHYWRDYLGERAMRFGASFRVPRPPFEELRWVNLENPFEPMFTARDPGPDLEPERAPPVTDLWSAVYAYD